MKITRNVSRQDGRWQAGAVLAICVLGMFLAGQLLTLARILARSIFPFQNFVVRDSATRWRAAFSPYAAGLLDILLWSLIVAAFAAITWRVRVGVLFPLAFVVIGFVAIAASVVGGIFGVDIDVGFLSDVSPQR